MVAVLERRGGPGAPSARAAEVSARFQLVAIAAKPKRYFLGQLSLSRVALCILLSKDPSTEE